MKKTRAKTLAYVVLFALIFNSFAINCYADSIVNGTIKVEYLKQNKISNAHLSLYRVASLNSNKIIPVGDFAKYSKSISWDIKNTEDWTKLQSTLYSYIKRDQIKAFKDQYTNSNYQAEFKNLQKGLYLVVIDKKKSGKTTYISEPFFVMLPYNNSGVDDYNPLVRPKFTTKKDKPSKPDKPNDDGDDEEDYIKRKVLKVWQNDEKKLRPKSIEVQLLKNGSVYKTAKLTEKNNWRKTWQNLSENDEWLVVEKDIPQNYTTVIEKKGITFVITNTYLEEIPDNPAPKDKGKQKPKNNDPLEELPDNKIPLAKLPQTGVIWWPAPSLFSAGLIFIIIGLRRKRKES